MLQRLHALDKSQSSAIPSPSLSSDVASINSTGATHLNTVIKIYTAIEFLAVVGSSFLIGLFYHGVFLDQWQTDPKYIGAAIFIATLVSLTSLGLHSFTAIRTQPRHTLLWKGVGGVVLAFSIFLSIIFIAKLSEEYSRITFILQILGVSITVTSMRALFYSWLQNAIASKRIAARRIALIGDISHCSRFADRLKESGFQTVCFFQLPKRRDLKSAIANSPKIREMIAKCRPLRLDDVVVLANNEIMPAMFELASSMAELPVGVHIVPVDALNVLASAQITQFGNLQTIQLYRLPLSTFDRFIKRIFDLSVAAISLIVLSPLFLVVSVAIKLDSPGPIFFRQRRHGFNNEVIRVLKFRSMTAIEDGDRFEQAIENDPRVTRVGLIMRRTNVDELPQLVNVLRGDMSIVGPRPHATAHNAIFHNIIMPFSRRHNVKPGITGWAQVNGFRGATDTVEKMQQRIEYDLQYVDNWSFLFDLKIIMMTLFSKRAYSNAY